MCSSIASSATNDIGIFLSDSEIFQWLDKLQTTPGFPLPSSIIDGVNPHQIEPAVLPENILFYVESEGPKQTTGGLWKKMGEPCKIYSDSSIDGWRSTLVVDAGQAPGDSRTGWMMQEYWIDQKDPMKPKGTSSLCRVFCANEEGGNNENRSSKASMGSLLVKRAINDKSLDIHQGMNIGKDDCFADGDFLELDDLVDPQSSSTTSGNSSCISADSDRFFDSEALLRELRDGDDVFPPVRPAGHNVSISKPTEKTVTIFSGDSPDKELKSSAEPLFEEQHSQPNTSTPNRSLPNGRENAKKRPLSSSPSNMSAAAAASSSGQKSSPDKVKKVAVGKTMKKFLCFLVL